MSRNGSGGYSLPVNTWNPATTGVSATVTDWQALINDIATAMQQSPRMAQLANTQNIKPLLEALRTSTTYGAPVIAAQ